MISMARTGKLRRHQQLDKPYIFHMWMYTMSADTFKIINIISFCVIDGLRRSWDINFESLSRATQSISGILLVVNWPKEYEEDFYPPPSEYLLRDKVPSGPHLGIRERNQCIPTSHASYSAGNCTQHDLALLGAPAKCCVLRWACVQRCRATKYRRRSRRLLHTVWADWPAFSTSTLQC